jgi:hypothetical protein
MVKNRVGGGGMSGTRSRIGHFGQDFVRVLRFSPDIPPGPHNLYVRVYSYQKGRGTKPAYLLKSSGFLEIREHWVEEYFNVAFEGLR